MTIFATLGGALAFGISVITLMTAIIGLRKAIAVSTVNKAAIAEVHVLVNSRLTAVLDRVTQLTEALKASDIAVPDDPNISAMRDQL